MSSFLTNEDYSIISRLLAFFSTSYGGENARLKLIQPLDHSMSICTSRSSRIQPQVKCQHLISRLLSAALQKQISIYHDGGLYFSLIFCRFLMQLRDMPNDPTKRIALLQSCLNSIDRMNLDKTTIAFDSIHPLMAIVRSVICKPLAYHYSALLREQMCLLTVRSFLENVSSQQQFILTIEGLDVQESKLYNGLLYQISALNTALCSNRTSVCLYFTISLAGDYTIEDVDHIETEQQMFEWIQNSADRIAEQIIGYSRLHGNGLILCQKVIHPSVKMKLKQYGINTIDRLGRQYTPYFCYLTGCRPIETLTFNNLDERYFGTVTEIRCIEIGPKLFLQFSNQSHPFHTLLLCSNTEQSLLELKECINASHHILTYTPKQRSLIRWWLYREYADAFLKSQMDQLASRYLFHTIRHVIRAQDDRDCVIDRLHGHLWFVSDTNEISDRCACELYSTTDRWKHQWKQWSFDLDDEREGGRMEGRKGDFHSGELPEVFRSFSNADECLSHGD